MEINAPNKKSQKWTRVGRYEFMRPLALTSLLLFHSNLYACGLPSGQYKSVSETHWSYSLLVKSSNIKLHFETYWFDQNSERQETETEEIGTCYKVDESYLLKFKEREIKVQFIPSLSHESVGITGSSPAIIGDFFERGFNIELGNFKNDS